MEKKEISVVINTYNAEKFLQRVLDSVKDFDEVVICDMESTDHTVDIAQRARCKVVTFPKVIIPVLNQLEPLPYRVLKVRGYSSLTLTNW